MGLPVLEPFSVEEMEYEFDFGIQGRIQLSTQNLTIYGFSRANFLDLRPCFSGNNEGDKMDLEIDIEIPELFVDGYLKANGQVSVYKIDGNGIAHE